MYTKRVDTKFYLGDNKDFISNDLMEALNSGKISEDKLYSNIYALTDEDFEKLLKENNISNAKYLLLNKIPKDSRSAYSFNEYIKISDKDTGKVTLKYNADGKSMPIKIDSSIDEMPYNLEAYNDNQISIFTSESNIQKFIDEYGIDEGNPVYYYFVKIKLIIIKKKYLKMRKLSNYVPKFDHRIIEIIRAAMDKEQTRNERFLNLAIQIILITIRSFQRLQ